MTDTSAQPPKRKSRFDQTEPSREVRKPTRSRSPAPRHVSENGRSRSPVTDRDSVRSPASSSATSRLDPAAAAAAAAAKINEQLRAKAALNSPDVPPVRSATTPTAKSQTPIPSEIYTQDGDFIKDIEVNDLKNRYTLTKGQTQKEVNKHFVMAH